MVTEIQSGDLNCHTKKKLTTLTVGYEFNQLLLDVVKSISFIYSKKKLLKNQ